MAEIKGRLEEHRAEMQTFRDEMEARWEEKERDVKQLLDKASTWSSLAKGSVVGVGAGPGG